MLGQPKYKVNNRVAFEQIQDGAPVQIDGVIYVVDPNGTSEQQEEPSYDIEAVYEGNVLLFKHVRESLVTERRN